MRVLLTGATGFIGKQVLHQLNEIGVEVVTMGRGLGFSENRHIQLDMLAIDDFSEYLKKAKASHLIHLAWYVEHGKFWSSTSNMDWIKTTFNLVDSFCKNGGEHITVAGTCAEYDWDYGVCNENITPLNPRSIYGVSKNATRQICHLTCEKAGVPLAWGRIFFPYGNGEPSTRLLPSLAAVLKNNLNPFAVNLNCYRDFLHVSDVASGLVMISFKQAMGNINISSGEPVRIHEIVKLMAENLTADPDKVYALSLARVDEPKFLIGANDLLLRLGWSKKVSMAEGLKDFYN